MEAESVSHEIVYLSANCNRKPHAFDWRSRLIVYPSCQSVCLYDYLKYKHVQLLNGHSKQVNCARWIDSVDAFVTSSLDGTANVWTRGDDVDTSDHYCLRYKCIGPGEGLIAVDSICISSKPEEKIFLTCGSANNESLLFWINDEQVACHPVNQFVFDIQMIHCDKIFGPKVVLIGFVGNDTMVHLISFDVIAKSIQKLIKLPGHDDWIQSLDMKIVDSDTLFLASGSQDNFIRIWKINKSECDKSSKGGKVFTLGKDSFEVQIETVLLGHEGWVYSVQFRVNEAGKLFLLSSSMDKSIVLWQQPDSDDIWTELVRVGDVGGSNLGFVGALINQNLNQIIGQSFNGALHIWSYDDGSKAWSPSIGLGGHWESVTDLAWEPRGKYLLTCSLDQTTRLHSPWVHTPDVTWHEIARPQIHGYDLNCLTVIDGLTFASGAEEKTVRIFGGTKSFLKSMENISKVDLSTTLKVKRDLPECASVPPLGLSNKAIYSEVDMDEYFKTVISEEPPLEEILQQNTLWPEIQKLFGHTYEIFAVTCNHRGNLLASACKASKSNSANITLWDISSDFKKIMELHFHTLTITQLRFSPNDKYLISVSRDRTWCLYQINYVNDGTLNVNQIAYTDKKTSLHSRIIWDVSWTPDNIFFATCSRDKKAIFWAIDQSIPPSDSSTTLVPVKTSSNSCLTLKDPITTIDISSLSHAGGYFVALGLEVGTIMIFQWSVESGWQGYHRIDQLHSSLVKRLRFRPGDDSTPNQLLLASCGEDRKVVILKISPRSIH